MQEISLGRFLFLFFHLIGLGLLVCVQAAGFILESHYRKAPDLPSKAALLRVLRPIGLLSPLAIVVMLVTGIGNMRTLGLGVFSMGWLTAKIIFFGTAVGGGVTLGIQARKRGKLVASMLKGDAPANAQELLSGYDKQMRWSYVVMPILLMVILSLSVYGRLGVQ